jgi:hypothetical protein
VHDDGLARSWTLVGDSDDEDDDIDIDSLSIILPELLAGSGAAIEEKKAAAVLYKVRT